MYCSQCGQKISEQANFCNNCGASIQNSNREIDLEDNIDNSNAILKRKNISKKTIIILSIIFSVLLSLIIFGIIFTRESNTNTKDKSSDDYEDMLEESRENIAPYLEYLPSFLNDDGKIEMDSEHINNKSNVYFLGMTGTVSYYTNKYGVVTKMMWASHEFYTHEEHKELVKTLNDYFGEPAKIVHEQYGQYNDTDYYWTDESVPCTVILYTSVRANHEDETDRIEIYWDMEKDITN